MNRPLVSIILFAHAPYAKFIPGSLGSILKQSNSSLEVFVLGDGSKELEQALAPFREDPRCIPASQGTLPFLQASNELMKQCHGKYLGTWNSDDIYEVDHVKVLVKALEEDASLGGAFDNTEYFSDQPAHIDKEKAKLSLGPMVKNGRGKKLAAARLSVQDILKDNFMTGPSSLITKTAFESVGGYDKDIYLNCDLHWFYRLTAYFPVRYVDYIGVRKRIHPLNNTAVNPHYEYGVRELEHIRDRYPDVYSRIGKSAFNKKLGRKYLRLGLYYERNGELTKARAAYKQAMLLRKWSFRYHWEYIRSTRRSGRNA
jgi:glycosyltransferase involved in cell wall biosynthesis